MVFSGHAICSCVAKSLQGREDSTFLTIAYGKVLGVAKTLGDPRRSHIYLCRTDLKLLELLCQQKQRRSREFMFLPLPYPPPPWLIAAKYENLAALLIAAPRAICFILCRSPVGSCWGPACLKHACFDFPPSLSCPFSLIGCSWELFLNTFYAHKSLSQGNSGNKAEKISRIIPRSVLNARLRFLTEISYFIPEIWHSLDILFWQVTFGRLHQWS